MGMYLNVHLLMKLNLKKRNFRVFLPFPLNLILNFLICSLMIHFSLMFPNFHEVSFASGRQNFFFSKAFFYRNLNLLQSCQIMNNLSLSLYFSLSLSFKLYG